jgi:hypothetical protein
MLSGGVGQRKGTGAYVFHGSKEATRYLLISIHCKCYREGTTLLFPRDEHHTRFYGSWTDLVAGAIHEDPVVIDAL